MLPFEELTRTLVSLNVKIVENKDTLLCLVEFKDQNVSSITVLTNLKIIINLGGAAKPIKKLIHHALKQKKSELCSHTFKCSNYHGDY